VGPDSTAAVNDFMAKLDHPHKRQIEAIRRIILGADSAIAEGIKWNAPSFRTTEYFATVHLRAKDGVGVILHLGAKVREHSTRGMPIEDPAGLLKWLSKDRAMTTFGDMKDLAARRKAFERIVREWIRYV
jgi:hypothetical protein